MRAVDIIQGKRDGRELTGDEIRFFVDGYTRGSIPDYQASALASHSGSRSRRFSWLIRWLRVSSE